MGFRYTISPPITCCVWGFEATPGNFTGLVGDLQRDLTDIAWADIFLLASRTKYIDFSTPYNEDLACFLVS